MDTQTIDEILEDRAKKRLKDDVNLALAPLREIRQKASVSSVEVKINDRTLSINIFEIIEALEKHIIKYGIARYAKEEQAEFMKKIDAVGEDI